MRVEVEIEGLENQQCPVCKTRLYRVDSLNCRAGACVLLYCGMCGTKVAAMGIGDCPHCKGRPPAPLFKQFLRWWNTPRGAHRMFRITAILFTVIDTVWFVTTPNVPHLTILVVQVAFSIGCEAFSGIGARCGGPGVLLLRTDDRRLGRVKNHCRVGRRIVEGEREPQNDRSVGRPGS